MMRLMLGIARSSAYETCPKIALKTLTGIGATPKTPSRYRLRAKLDQIEPMAVRMQRACRRRAIRACYAFEVQIARR
ncbi:hypothetical protein BN2476_170116 [Paraburkholderia piptadeniae]|uniref:Uncharacterized protein n=1 Tax=Paraburkholderia piptadeniae TaxID=1701573 RepID=A0A1N7RTG1_9BURK|nr:hypothetical protein BN2476_170116 [Paraburkholderia piptadeniae]